MINVEIIPSDADNQVNMIVLNGGIPIGKIQYEAQDIDHDTFARIWVEKIEIDEAHQGKGYASEALREGDFRLAEQHEGDVRKFTSKFPFTRYINQLDRDQILEESHEGFHSVRFRLKRK